MTYKDEIFPERISRGAIGGPGFLTTITVTGSGFEQRNIDWDQSRSRYDVSHDVKKQRDLDILLAFFYNMVGRAHSFKYKDPSDYAANDVIVIESAIGGEQNSIQLIKNYIIGQETYVRTITKPLASTVVLKVNNSAVSGSISNTTGLFNLTTPLAVDEQLNVSFEFFVPVRFDVDEMATRIDQFEVYTWGGVPLIEVRGE